MIGEVLIEKPKSRNVPYKTDRVYFHLVAAPYYENEYEDGFSHSFDCEVEQVVYINTAYFRNKHGDICTIDKFDRLGHADDAEYNRYIFIDSRFNRKHFYNEIFKTANDAFDYAEKLAVEVQRSLIHEAANCRARADNLQVQAIQEFLVFNELLKEKRNA